MNPPLPNKTTQTTKSDWPIVLPLILLSLVPMVAGMARLHELGSGADITPENARFHALPLPVVLHILSSVPFSILGAFQFAPSLRRRRPEWHRSLGRWVLAAGLLSALSGLAMTLLYPIPANLQGPLLWGVRLLVGVGMAAGLVRAWQTIRQRKVNQHRAWMIRSYALGQGAGTQVLLFLPLVPFFGTLEGLPRDLLMSAAWLLNALVAEWLVRKL